MICLQPLHSFARRVSAAVPALLVSLPPIALAQAQGGFDKINSTVINVQTILVTISIAVVTIWSHQ
jgi:type IV secretion system protein VirB2